MTPERLDQITKLVYGGGLTAMDAVELVNAVNQAMKREEELFVTIAELKDDLRVRDWQMRGGLM